MSKKQSQQSQQSQQSNYCPCNSGKDFNNCCKPFLLGSSIPDNPEALMRSRYTAYTMANIDYIVQTMQGPAFVGFDKISAKDWAESANWQSLKVLSSSIDSPESGRVEFIAKYKINGKMFKLQEHSVFHFIDNRWFYVDKC